MKMTTKLLLLMLAALSLSACRGEAEATLTKAAPISDVYTAVALTLMAQANSVTLTATPLPTVTPTSWPSPTIMPSTPTTQSISVSYSTANGCYNAVYVSDVTIPDGTVLAPGESFTKTWKFQNTGSCAWESDFELTFEMGENMEGENTFISETVATGETDSFSVSLVAPETEGSYTGYWRLTTASGNAFGQSVFVQIVVSDDASTATPTITTTATATATATTVSTPTFTPIPTSTTDASYPNP